MMWTARRRVVAMVWCLALASAAPAFGQITSGGVTNYPVAPKYAVAYDTQDQVYLLVADGPPVRGQFTDRNGAPVGPMFNISLETPLGSSTPYESWSTVAFGGTSADPTFLVTYAEVMTSTFVRKFGRLVRYRAGAAALVSDRGTITDVNTQWFAADDSRATWFGQQFIVTSRVLPDGQAFPLTQLNHFDLTGVVTGGQLLGDELDYEGGPSVACAPTGVCLATGFAAGIPFGGTGGIWARLFDATTLAPLSGLFYLDDHSAFMDTPHVVYASNTGQFNTVWFRSAGSGILDFRVVHTDGTLGPLDETRSFGPGAGEPALAYNAISRTSLLLTKWQSEAALYCVELGDDGYPVPSENPLLVTPYDGLVLQYRTEIATSDIEPRWLATYVLAAAAKAAILQGSGEGGAAAQLTSPSPGSTLTGSSAAFSWTAGTNASSYLLTIGSSLGGADLFSQSGSAQTASVTGLPTDGRTLYVRLKTTFADTTTISNDYTLTAYLFVTPPPGAFTKTSPANGATGLSLAPTLSWAPSTGATLYQFCIDTINNNSCDTSWQVSGTSFTLNPNTTYFWQVRAVNGGGTVLASDGWFSFTTGKGVHNNGDFIGDGNTDLIWQHPLTGGVLLWQMNGSTYVGSTIINPGGTLWQVVGTGDFHGNGYTDLLWQDPASGDLLIWEMHGPNYVSSTVIHTSTYWKVVAVGDFNGDGKPDIVWQYPGTNAVLLWTMNGTQYVSSTLLNQASTVWQVVGAADFHGNGHTDLLWQHPLTGDLMIWEMNGSNYVSSTTIPTSTLWKVAAVGDFNGDGKPDIVWQYPGTNAVLLWLMNNTQYVSSTILNPGGTLWRVKGPR